MADGVDRMDGKRIAEAVANEAAGFGESRYAAELALDFARRMHAAGAAASVDEAKRVFAEMIAAGVIELPRAAVAARTCRECGCTEVEPCLLPVFGTDQVESTCGWVAGEGDLCTACLPDASERWLRPAEQRELRGDVKTAPTDDPRESPYWPPIFAQRGEEPDEVSPLEDIAWVSGHLYGLGARLRINGGCTEDLEQVLVDLQKSQTLLDGARERLALGGEG